MNEPLNILFKFPCRGRTETFFKSLDSLNDNIRDRNNYLISLTLDEDDELLNRPEIIERINTYPNTKIEWGLSKSKIDAVNRSFPDYDWDIVVVWSNDMFATMYGFDDIMRSYMYQVINNCGDEMLFHFPEKDTMAVLNVLYVATRKYYERFGYVYHPSYLSLWADNETYDVAKILNKYHYIEVLGLYEHRNPAYGYNTEIDELFDYQQSLWGVDERNYFERKIKNFDLL